MEIQNMKRVHSPIFKMIPIFFIVSSFVSAGDITSISAYQMMSEAPSNSRTYLWTGAVNAVVGPDTQNWNRPVIESWGIGSRYPDHNVKPYSETDPGFNGPNGESYGIEIEFGDMTIQPRSPGSKNVRFYTDFGQTGISGSGPDRAEMHIHSTLKSLNVTEGSTIWVGWSEYYTNLDRNRMSTVFQFRNQPNVDELAESGFTQEEIAALIAGGYNQGGPATAIETKSEGGQLHYHFAVRSGAPTTWTIPENHKHTRTAHIETGKWYDFIVKLKYSQNNDGMFKIWAYEKGSQPVYEVTDTPEWSFIGPTMYNYPSGYSNPIPQMEFRFGVYRYNAKNATDITASDRYMTKYAGPMRIWVGTDDSGYDEVKPR